MKNVDTPEVALIESEEEAGVLGKISGPPIIVPFEKNNKVISMLTYPMKVTKVKNNWEEQEERTRKIVELKDTGNFPFQKGIAAGIEYLKDMIL